MTNKLYGISTIYTQRPRVKLQTSFIAYQRLIGGREDAPTREEGEEESEKREREPKST